MDWKEQIQAKLVEFGAEINPLDDRSFEMNSKSVLMLDAETSVQDALVDIVIHEDVFRYRPEQLVSRLRSIAGLNARKIHGRKTKVREISREDACDFIHMNHLMEFGGGKYFYGLVEENELVAVAVFSRAIWMKNENPPYHSTELVRYCSRSGCTVIGGLDKLVQHFFHHHETHDLVTYIDLEWSNGESYLRIGFEEVDRTKPLKFLVERSSWKRRLFDGGNLMEGEYLVSNRGNLKLRRVKV